MVSTPVPGCDDVRSGQDAVVAATTPHYVPGAAGHRIAPRKHGPSVGCPGHLIEARDTTYWLYTQTGAEPMPFTRFHRQQIGYESGQRRSEPVSLDSR